MNIKKNKKISVIIPVYNEASVINKLMNNLMQFKDRHEIIFIDGGSTDGTDKIIKEKYRLLYYPQKGRSGQMNYGALVSEGDILLFIHADSILSENAFDEIYKIMSKGYKAGCFRIKFISSSFVMKICGFMSNIRVRFRNIAFGDQGIFIEKEYFYKLSGFSDIPLMEDYQLSMDIKKDGEKIVLSDENILSSERRFVKNGRIKTMIMMQKLQYMYRKGEDIEVIADMYK